MQILLNKLDSSLPPLDYCRRGLSRSFYRMVAACLDKDPAKRSARPFQAAPSMAPRELTIRPGLARCLRPTASELLHHRFIRKGRDRHHIVVGLTDRSVAMRESREQGTGGCAPSP